MAKKFYRKQIEVEMKEVHDNLSEKDRRLYAAIEAKKLPYGGVSYIANILKCSRNTIYNGLKELEFPERSSKSGIRRIGGGRKKAIENVQGLEEAFLESIKDHTAGDPMNEGTVWTDLTLKEISRILTEKGFRVGEHVVKQLLKKNGYVKRSASKRESIGTSENRDEQFLNISRLKKEYEEAGNPVLSGDSKKRNS